MLQAIAHQRRCVVVQYHEVGIATRLQVADPVFQAQCPRAAQSGQIQRFERIQTSALQLHDLVGFVQCVEQREAGTRADIRSQAHIEFVLLGHRQVEQAAAQKQIGSRAESHRRACFGQACTFLITQMHAVGKHRTLTQQLVVVIHIQIAFALREQRLDPLDFLKVLADMGMQIHIRIFTQQLARQG